MALRRRGIFLWFYIFIFLCCYYFYYLFYIFPVLRICIYFHYHIFLFVKSAITNNKLHWSPFACTSVCIARLHLYEQQQFTLHFAICIDSALFTLSSMHAIVIICISNNNDCMLSSFLVALLRTTYSEVNFVAFAWWNANAICRLCFKGEFSWFYFLCFLYTYLYFYIYVILIAQFYIFIYFHFYILIYFHILMYCHIFIIYFLKFLYLKIFLYCAVSLRSTKM